MPNLDNWGIPEEFVLGQLVTAEIGDNEFTELVRGRTYKVIGFVFTKYGTENLIVEDSKGFCPSRFAGKDKPWREDHNPIWFSSRIDSIT